MNKFPPLIFLALVLNLFFGQAWAQADTKPRYQLDVNVDPSAQQLSAQEKVVFTNNSSVPLTEIYFHVYPNRVYDRQEKSLLLRYSAYFKVNVFPDGFPKNLFRLKNLRVNGQSASGEWEGEDRTLLKVALAEVLAPGKSVEIQMDFDLRLPKAYSRFGVNQNIAKLSQWYPLLAFHDSQGWRKYPFYPFHRPFFSEAAYYSVRLTVPNQQVVIHTGLLAKEESLPDGKKQLTIETPLPVRDFTVAMSKDYRVIEETWSHVRIKSFYLPGDEEAGQSALTDTKALMEYYTALFGPYPYKEFSIAPVPLGYGGEQMSNLAFIDTRAYKLPGFLNRYFDFLVSHEVGHQWFYNTIGVDEYTQMWLEEGVNSYFILQYLEHKYGPQAQIIDYPPWAKAGQKILPKLTFQQTRDYLYKRMVRVGYETQSVLGPLSRFREPSGIFFLAYGKGARILEMLKNEVGQETVEKIFRRIAQEYQFAVLDIKDFRRICTEESGKDLAAFFDQWLLSTKYMDYVVTGAKPGQVTLERWGEIQMPVKVQVHFKDGTSEEFIWGNENKKETVVLKSQQPVRQVAIDADGEWLDIDQTNNFWPRKLHVMPVPLYLGLYDLPLFQPEDSFNLIVGPEVSGNGLGIKASLQKPYDQILYSATDYQFGERLQHSRAGYLLKNVLRSQSALGFEINDTKDWEDGSEDVAGGKIFLRRELWPAAYSFSEVNDHATLYLVRNQRLSDHNEFLEYREGDPQLEYRRRAESIVGAALKLSNRGPYPDPVQGYQVHAWAENAGHFLGATQYYYRSALDTSFYQPVTPHSRLALRAKYGWGFPEEKDLYQLGGMDDLRGYDYKSFRGSNILLGSAEYRFPLAQELNASFFDQIIGVEAINGVAFFDAGAACYDQSCASKWKKDVGVGLRFMVNFGSLLEKVVVRFDAAYPLAAEEKDTHFWLGLNHAF